MAPCHGTFVNYANGVGWVQIMVGLHEQSLTPAWFEGVRLFQAHDDFTKFKTSIEGENLFLDLHLWLAVGKEEDCV